MFDKKCDTCERIVRCEECKALFFLEDVQRIVEERISVYNHIPPTDNGSLILFYCLLHKKPYDIVKGKNSMEWPITTRYFKHNIQVDENGRVIEN